MKSISGIEPRHSRSCPAYSDKTKRCSKDCKPRYRATPRINGVLDRSRWFANVDEAQTWLANYNKRVRQGQTVEKQSGDTLAKMVHEFIADLESGKARSKRRTPYKPKTARMYIWSLKNHVLTSELAKLRMTAIRPKHIKAWIAEMEFTHGPSQVNNALNPMRVCFARALDAEVIEADPMASIHSLPEESRIPEIIDATEAEARLALLTDYDRAIWGLVFYSGLRVGEIRALQVEDVDLELGVIRVRSTYDDIEGRQSPKTAAGTREVPMIFPLRRLLTAYLPHVAHGTLFPGQRGGESFNPSHLRLRTYRAWENGGYERLCPHEGRHVFASWLIASGVEMFYVSRYMGHKDTRITERVYAHLDRDHIARNVARVEAALTAASAASAA